MKPQRRWFFVGGNIYPSCQGYLLGDRENRVAKTGTALPVLKRFAKGGSMEAGMGELCGDSDTSVC